jgi:polyferredoxin
MTIRTARSIRRLSQIVFFVLFFWLILKTNFDVNLTPDDTGHISLPYPVSIALEFDPLAAVGTLLATGTLYKGLLWSLTILIPTVFFGRFFCGWVCPMGTLNHWISEIPSERRSRRGKNKIQANRYKPYQKIKYYILLVMLAGALAGTLQTGLLDPLSLLARSIGTVVLPTLHAGAQGVTSWITSLGISPLSSLAEGTYSVLSAFLLPFRPMFFNTIVSLGLFFAIVLILNRVFTRFWCRGICPLGALLGLFSRWTIFGLEKRETNCDNCGLCAQHCQGGDNPEPGLRWHQAECHVCLNCQAACPRGSLKFTFFPKSDTASITNPPPVEAVDITRRKAVAATAAGLLMLPLLRSGASFAANPQPMAVRPPGSVGEADFLARCIRCGQCMRVCPNNALHPTLLETGIEGIWTPILIARIGYCEPTCTLCTQVCPTGAIEELTVTAKVGDESRPPMRIGTAFIDRGRCLPWAMATPCIVCEEWCPTSPKAIYLEELTVTDSRGKTVVVKRPYVDPNLCTGCGACEFACPVADRAAIRITSVGESRSRENQILLERRTAPRQHDHE